MSNQWHSIYRKKYEELFDKTRKQVTDMRECHDAAIAHAYEVIKQ